MLSTDFVRTHTPGRARQRALPTRGSACSPGIRDGKARAGGALRQAATTNAAIVSRSRTCGARERAEQAGREQQVSQGLNRYAYVDNSPLNATDPSGMAVVPGGAEASAERVAVSELPQVIKGFTRHGLNQGTRRRCPDYLAKILGLNELTDIERLAIQQALADELLLTRLGADDEPNERGLNLESLIDLVRRQ